MTVAPSPPTSTYRHFRLWLAAGLTLALFWAYWTTLTVLVKRWSSDPQTSHGFVIPFVAVFLLWFYRDRRPRHWPDSFSWWGVALLAEAALQRLAATYFYLESLDAYSLLPTLAGLVLLLGGWPALRWAWIPLAYLFFLVPLPYQIETALSGPLQRLATLCSTYTLQTLGYLALSEGNVIVLEQGRIEVVRACNGLGMLGAFFALSTAVALMINRPVADRVILFLSAIPIGVLMNLVRIACTGIAHQLLGSTADSRLFHDVSGWLMMPLALGVMALELWFLDRLFVSPMTTGPVPAVVPAARSTGPRPPPGPAVYHQPRNVAGARPLKNPGS